MIELILFAVYLLSAILAWRYVKLVYSKRGIWSTLNPGLPEVLFMFIPVFNTVFCFYGWLLHYPIRKTAPKRDFNKFFNVKK